MSGQILVEFIILVVLLFFSVFTSLAETALISVNRNKLKQKISLGSKNAKRAIKILEAPEKLFGTVLVMNNIANLLAASLATAIAFQFFKNDQEAVAIAAMSITTVVIIGEVTAKTIAAKRPVVTSLLVVFPIQILIIVCAPFVWIFTLITRLVLRLFGIPIKENSSLLAEEEIKALIHIGEEEGDIEIEEGQMLRKVFNFGDMTVREAMTPLSDMVALEASVGYEDMMETVVDAGCSRLPIYDGEKDNIVGVVQVKDLLTFWENQQLIILEDVMDPPLFVPSIKKISDLLQEFQAGKSHMAIVTNLAGKIVGLITLEDIIEEIVGEIEDEYDARFTDIEKTGKDTYKTSGYCLIEKVNEELNVELPAADFVMLNGYIISELGHVPKSGETIDLGSIQVRIQEVDGHRIIQLEIKKKEDAI